ncbi:hypothetical protein R6V09_05730 [Streptomyces sp. W16]|uniref:hypothetical protein n=1 Tax=Streptomyces sp. W16 TaxID=3076631 RepID=UPI00295C125C|nr:hypothetical protein [Streptomyces sp. W16]MDV9169637.1 hypothetical protein [Streptomyces sp. W16]
MERSRLEAAISRALASRAANRPLVAEIDRQWGRFRDRFEELVEAVDRLVAESTTAGAQAADPGRALRMVETWRRPLADGGPDPLDRLARQVESTGTHLAAVRTRVNRDTVNIGVVGRTRAGKSTVLRAASGLDGTVLPSYPDNPTTASRSWIHHDRDRAEARVTLRTWGEFVDEYLTPLHASAKLTGGPPRDPAAFRTYPYPHVENEGAAADDRSAVVVPYLKKLLQAQRSLDDYLPLLEKNAKSGGEREPLVVPLEELAPYVSYPDGKDAEDSMPRLYHAVRDVHIHCDFPHLDATAMVLVDLPGAGEAGLDVQRHFLRDLTHGVDFLLHVKRGASDGAFFKEVDYADLRLTQLARGDVQMADFVMVVVNPDAGLSAESVRNLRVSSREAARNYQMRAVECPLGGSAETADAAVREQLLPVVLGHLADRLAEMDRATFDGLGRRMDEVVRDIVGFAQDVTVACEQWRLGIPDEVDSLQSLTKQLRNHLAQDLASVYEEYDAMVHRREHIPQIETAVGEAAERVRSWARTGFDHDNEEAWRFEARSGMYQSWGETWDLWFNRARTKLAQEFGGVDLSVDRAVDLLWQRVADSLRGHRGTRTGGRPVAGGVAAARRTPPRSHPEEGVAGPDRAAQGLRQPVPAGRQPRRASGAPLVGTGAAGPRRQWPDSGGGTRGRAAAGRRGTGHRPAAADESRELVPAAARTGPSAAPPMGTVGAGGFRQHERKHRHRHSRRGHGQLRGRGHRGHGAAAP